jgi:hypothetical protein
VPALRIEEGRDARYDADEAAEVVTARRKHRNCYREGRAVWWWRKVRRADIPAELRDRFELFGENVMAHAVGAGELSSKGVELDGLLRMKRGEIVAWLLERRDIAERHEDRVETVEWAILIFVVAGVVLDVLLLTRG